MSFLFMKLKCYLVVSIISFFSLLQTNSLYANKDLSVSFELQHVSWPIADSILRSQLRECPSGIDSIRLLREFTASLVRSSWDDEYYATAHLNDSYTLPQLFNLYNVDSAVGICSDYADFFAKLLDHYSIKGYPVTSGLQNSTLRGHTQVAIKYIYKGKTIVQIHDPMFNLEYVDVNNEPIDICEHIRLCLNNNYIDSVNTLNGITPRTILIRKVDWMFVRTIYPYKKDIVGKANSNNSKFKLLALIKGSLQLMVINNKKDITIFLNKSLNYPPPSKAKYLKILFPVSIYNVANVTNDSKGADEIMQLVLSAKKQSN